MFKELYKTLDEKEILLKQKESLEMRIIKKINSLGLKATTYSELVIKYSGVRDKYLETFAKIEELDKRLAEVESDIDCINKQLKEIAYLIPDLNEIEYKVFLKKYIENKTLDTIAIEEKYGIDRIKQISAEISKKMKI